jgi:hypothetical protein
MERNGRTSRQRDVRFIHARGATSGYSWGSKDLRFVRCKTCGCIMYWEAARKADRKRPGVRCGINARNLDPEAIASVRGPQARRREDLEVA